MGPGGYGLLLAALGVGAVVGALLIGRLRAWLTPNQLLVTATLIYAVVLALMGLVRVPAVVAVALVPAGAAWTAVLSNLNADVQLFLPRWVRARGLGTYQTVFAGGQGIGAVAWGVLADRVGLVPTLVTAAVITGASAASVLVWPLRDSRHLNRDPAVYWSEPQLAVDPDPAAGPVVVTVTYPVGPENEAAFLDAMSQVRRSRMRTGAVQWGIFRDGENPERLVEMYVVPTWEEHLRQHTGRLTGADQEVEQRARSLADGPAQVAHLLPTGDGRAPSH
jgi:MFS family permease